MAGGAMATPGQLVEMMAEVLGVPAATVSQYDRQLAEAGLRTIGGRGASAAKVTATDAANLLIAILGSPVSGASIKVARQMCEILGALPARSASPTSKLRKLGFDSLAALPRKHTLRDAVSALIEAASTGEPFGKSSFFYLNVDCPTLTARIGFGRRASSSEMADLTYELKDQDARTRAQFKPDLKQRRTVSFRTIEVLANLIGTEKK
jgi:hypothetical protein